MPGHLFRPGLVYQVIPRVAVRQWVLSIPIPLRILLATHTQLVSEVLEIVHRVIAALPIKHSGRDWPTAA